MHCNVQYGFCMWVVVIFLSSIQPPPLEPVDQPISIHTIEWNGNEWLIGGDTTTQSGGRLYINPLLVKFAENTFTDISLSLGIKGKVIDNIVWNGEYWLITYSFQEYGGVLQYKNNEFSRISLSGQPSLRATTMGWNGEYWLIGSNFLGYGYLVQYNGTTITDLGLNISAVRSLVWMGDSWLVSTTTPQWEDLLITYDGDTVVEVESPEGVGSITHSAWNGEYALLVSENRLVRFDKEHFEEIAYTGHAYGLQWNGEYWLIGSTHGALTMYDGVLFTDVTEKAGFTSTISALGWNGKYWLIGDTAGSIKMYDGVLFTDLTPQFEDSIQSTSIKPTEIPEPAAHSESDNKVTYIIWGSAIVLFIIVFFAVLSKKRR
ncbi:MAG: hypothetical protein PVF58_05370 [Candidatus Methanofastidiosia archaeon]